MAVDLKEHCTISYIEGQSGSLPCTLADRATHVECSIGVLTEIPAYVTQDTVRNALQQGLSEETVCILTLSPGQIIECGDIITDRHGETYDVLHVLNWYTHKEAFIRRL